MKNRRQILLLTSLSFVVFLTAILVTTYRPKMTQAYARKNIPSETQKRNEKLLNQLGQAYASMEKGDFDAAEASLKKILQQRPTYSMAMQQRPTYSMAMQLLGHVYYRSERYQKAEEVYRQMIKNNEFDASAYNNLGQALSRQGRHQEALKELLHSEKLNPNNETVYINLSVVYAALDQPQKARETFMTAHRLLLQKQQKNASIPEKLP